MLGKQTLIHHALEYVKNQMPEFLGRKVKYQIIIDIHFRSIYKGFMQDENLEISFFYKHFLIKHEQTD
jgi:hypothetical protein